MSQANARVSWKENFQFEWTKNAPYSSGNLNDIHGATKCNYFVEAIKGKNRELCSQIQLNCQGLKAPRLLAPLIGSADFYISDTATAKSAQPSHSSKQNVVVLAYTFDFAFDERKTQLLRFDDESQSHNYWVRTTQLILDTIQVMDRNGLFHPLLDDSKSYVFVDGEIFLIMPRAEEMKAEDMDGKSIRKAITGFKKFLKEHYNGPKTRDWNFFLNLMDTGTIKQIKKSPSILYAEQVVYYYRQILDQLMRPKAQVDEKQVRGKAKDEKTRSTSFQEELNKKIREIPKEIPMMRQWRDNISNNKVLLKVLTHKDYWTNNEPRDISWIQNGTTLDFFVRQTISHYNDRNRELHPLRQVSVRQFGEEICIAFCPLLSVMHHILVESKDPIAEQELPPFWDEDDTDEDEAKDGDGDNYMEE